MKESDEPAANGVAGERAVDFIHMRREALRYWERRRLWHNLFLVFPTLLGYAPAIMSGAVGDRKFLGPASLLTIFVLAIVGANICYSFAYALEFLFGNNNPKSRWQRFQRDLCFILGTLLAMALAFGGGRNIYLLEVYGPPVFNWVETRQYSVLPPDFAE